VQSLAYRNIVPNRFNRPRELSDLVTLSLDQHLDRIARLPATDVLLAQFALPYGEAVRRSASRRRIPYAVYLRGDDVWVWPHAWPNGLAAFRDVVGGASLVLSVSEALLREARRLAGDDLSRSVVVANGVDLAVFRPPSTQERLAVRAALGIKGDTPVIICVAAALERKGWRELLSAVAQLDEPPVVLAVTTGQDELNLSAMAAGKSPAVRLLRYHDVPPEKLSGMYQAADVFCLPSYGEGMSNAVLEALASGLPVVTTPVGGHPEVIDSGIDGELIPMKDVEALSVALDGLLRNPTRREAMGRAARARARAIGSPRENGGRVARLLDALVDRTPLTVSLLRSSYAMAGS
jgi:glycosyltransferase involved in cell wall biosynthesis